MKTEMIVANVTTKNDAGVNVKTEVGKLEWNRPETIAELTENFDDAEILKCFTAGYVVKVQAELRNPGKTKIPMTPLLKAFAGLTSAEQQKLLEQLGH